MKELEAESPGDLPWGAQIIPAKRRADRGPLKEASESAGGVSL